MPTESDVDIRNHPKYINVNKLKISRNALNLNRLRSALRKISVPRGAEGDWVEIGKVMKIIDEQLLNEVSVQAKESPRLRKNYNFHQRLDEKCHRFINAVEPGTEVPIHKHPTKDETFVILRGKVRVTTHRDDGSIIEDVALCAEDGRYGVNIPKGVWHTIEALEPDSVIFECKEGPFVEHEVDGILNVEKKR